MKNLMITFLFGALSCAVTSKSLGACEQAAELKNVPVLRVEVSRASCKVFVPMNLTIDQYKAGLCVLDTPEIANEGIEVGVNSDGSCAFQKDDIFTGTVYRDSQGVIVYQ